ncbi:MAG: metal ABC transporter substrate-binding protein [Rickettsia endosymbiont of Bryobia graminum]|nr:metal ABC transporter substrate-binding protein [Rickettsia endosymbiont of Bryobia graminum]
MIKKFFILIIVLFSYQSFANSKIKIVTSITPLAAITSMLVKDKAEVIAIASSNACPHHYNLKPSDLEKVQDANIVIYINEEFDGFVSKLMNRNNKNIIRVSDFPKLNLIKDNNYNNWHVWLDLYNVQIILEMVSRILIEQFPDLSVCIKKNLQESKKQIEKLIKIKNQQLSSLQDVILLTDSLEYFFENKYNVTKLYSPNQKSLKYIDNLKKKLNQSNSKCLILTIEQDSLVYQNLEANIVKVESENWKVDKINNELFYNQYLKIINQVAKCLNY